MGVLTKVWEKVMGCLYFLGLDPGHKVIEGGDVLGYGTVASLTLSFH